MSIFEYKAIDINTKELKGSIESSTLKSARRKLREKGLTIVDIHQVHHYAFNFKNIQISRLSKSDLVVFTRQLSSLLLATIPIDEALRTIAKNNSKKHLKRTITQIAVSLSEGHSLAKSFERNIPALPAYYVSTVEAGERSGELGGVLEFLANQIEREYRFKQKITTALIYPAMVSLIAFSVVVALLVFAVPQIVSVFADVKQELPPLTIFIINLSDFLANNFLYLALTFLAILLILNYALKFDSVRLKLHTFLGKTPIIGKIMIEASAIHFARIFALLHASGSSILVTLKNASDGLNYLPMRDAINQATIKVTQGSSLFLALSENKALPPMTLYMLASGEASGKLSEMLQKVADNQEYELDNYTSKVVSMFEPLMILLMGGLVLVIVLAILLPIFEINQISL
ncbi:General secretion pathway protein F [hydrothermal vent metagenome]|uniref:General secretion pathway protein F n=1 Tax=hydrothermal vent metagenome TaxID=652676 RepID=A0A1W1DBR5_9ZZZZ